LRCSALTQKLQNFHIYAVIIGLIQFDVDNQWPHLYSVGG